MCMLRITFLSFKHFRGVGITRRLVDRALGRRCEMALRYVDHLLAEHHAQQSDQRDQWRGRRADLDNRVSDADDGAH